MLGWYDLRRLRRKGIICRVSGSLLRHSLRLEAGKTLRTLGGQGLSTGPDRYEPIANRTVRPTERRTANHRIQGFSLAAGFAPARCLSQIEPF